MVHKNHVTSNKQLEYNYKPINKYNSKDLPPYGPVCPILHLLDTTPNLVGAEVGVFRGDSSIAMLTHLDISKLYLIDAYDKDIADSYNPDDASNKFVGDSMFASTKNRLKDHESKLEWLRMDSKYAHTHIEDGELDFVFIDGAHDYVGVTNDLENYYSKVKSGGLICGDDFSNKFKGFQVIEAVNDFFAKKGYTEVDVYKHPYKPENYFSTFGVIKK